MRTRFRAIGETWDGIYQYRVEAWNDRHGCWGHAAWGGETRAEAHRTIAGLAHEHRVAAGTARGCRAVRTRRIAAAMPIVAELDRYAAKVHGYDPRDGGPVWHVSRSDLERDYLATPIEHGRDSDVLAEVNWLTALGALEGTRYQVERFGHWAHGWYERIYVARDDAEALSLVDRMLSALADYRSLNDELLSEMEWERDHLEEGVCGAGIDCPCGGHVAYPHEPGTLYDCFRCEATCFCEPGFTCVHCAEGK